MERADIRIIFVNDEGEEIEFIRLCFHQFDIDFSYMEDDEFILVQSQVFNSLLYNEYIKYEKRNRY